MSGAHYVSRRPRSQPLRLPRRSSALRLLQQARDEAHRTAVGYNRKRRTMRTITSELLRIPGVGPKKRSALLVAFGSLQGVKEASLEQIAALEGFSEASARKVLQALGVAPAPASAGPASAGPASAEPAAPRPGADPADGS